MTLTILLEKSILSKDFDVVRYEVYSANYILPYLL